MRISDDLTPDEDLGTPRGLLEQPARRSGAMSDQRRLGEEAQRFLPEFQPQADRCRLIELFVNLIPPNDRRRGPAQLRRYRPRQPREKNRRSQYDDITPPFQMQSRENGQHDRHG